MTTTQDLVRQLGELAAELGPAVRPGGSDAALQSLVDTAREMFGAAACSLAVLSDDEDELVYTAASGAGRANVIGMRIAASAGLAGWVVQSGQPIAVNDLTQDKRFDRQTAERTGYVPDAMIVVPVASDSRTFGVLTLLDRDTDRPGAERDMTLLDVFATQAAVVLDAMAGFGDLGRVLLAALSSAATGGTDLADALADAATGRGRDADLAALAVSFAALAERGPAERRLALGVLREVSAYSEKRSSRTA